MSSGRLWSPCRARSLWAWKGAQQTKNAITTATVQGHGRILSLKVPLDRGLDHSSKLQPGERIVQGCSIAVRLPSSAPFLLLYCMKALQVENTCSPFFLWSISPCYCEYSSRQLCCSWHACIQVLQKHCGKCLVLSWKCIEYSIQGMT